ncbi:FG-GAP repeat domain-containing protein [Poriferisphaera sp. WC338]|uniref:FG-GAP repeat domain-containing protein n=1 Tax=Poriferisphaera sp. WC338 TaxID=3425129 RepID=UPI003D81B761
MLGTELGPLGNNQHGQGRVMGTADVFGNGPYDLFLTGRRILPFKRFMPNGAPIYGNVVNFESPSSVVSVFGPNESGDDIWGAYPSKTQINLMKFDREKMAFRAVAKVPLKLPRNIRTLTGTITSKGRVHTYFSVSDEQPYRPEGAHHHSAFYQPFDGSGIWRGNLIYHGLGAAAFDNTKLKNARSKFPIFGKGQDFMFSNPSLTVVNLGKNRERDLVGGDKQGTLHYFHNKSSKSIKLETVKYLSESSGHAIHHNGIISAPIAIPNPQTGLSDLIVGDTGHFWHYRFTGEFNKYDSPIYDVPTQVMTENPVLSLGKLPVITYGDLDGDGLIDLVAGNDVGDFYFIRNIGNNQHPSFDVPQFIMTGNKRMKISAGYRSIQGPGEARWGYTCPTLYDWNGDGLLDIIFNSILAEITVALQVPDQSELRFEEPRVLKCNGLELHLVWRTQPAVTDWNTGKQTCIIVNDEKNQLRRFWQADDDNVYRGDVLRLTDGRPIQAHSRRAAGQWGRTKLQAVDWDGDGLVDLLAGTGRSAAIPGPGGYPDDVYTGDRRQASVLFLRNAGTKTHPVFEYPKVLHFKGTKLEFGVHSCSPLAVDIGRGKLDLIVAMEDGSATYYEREDLSWPDKDATE